MLILLRYPNIFLFCHSLSNLIKDFLVPLELSTQSAVQEGWLDETRNPFPVAQSNMIFSPTWGEIFSLEQYFTPQCVPQTRVTLLQGTVVCTDKG